MTTHPAIPAPISRPLPTASAPTSREERAYCPVRETRPDRATAEHLVDAFVLPFPLHVDASERAAGAPNLLTRPRAFTDPAQSETRQHCG